MGLRRRELRWAAAVGRGLAAVAGLVSVNDHLLIAGTSGGVYDGTFAVTAVAGATITLDTGFGDPGTGGTWADAAPHTIVSVEDNGDGLARVVTAAAHGLAADAVVVLTGMTVYTAGQYVVGAIDADTKFVLLDAIGHTGVPFAGKDTGAWALA